LYKSEAKTEIDAKIGPLNCVAVSPDGTIIALGSKDGKIKVCSVTLKTEGAIVVEKMFELDVQSPVYDLKFHEEL